MTDLAKHLDKTVSSADRMRRIRENPNIVRTMGAVLALLPEEITGDVLDIGPGGGWEIPKLEERYPGRRVEVVMLFEEEAEALREIARDEIHVCDMHDLPEEWTGRFGLVFASFVLDHSPAPYIALCEWTRVLKTGGMLFLSTPNPGGYTGLGNKWPARMGDTTEHLFSAGFETTMELIRHVPKPGKGRVGRQALDLESYHEVPHWCGQRVHYWRRIWKLRKN